MIIKLINTNKGLLKIMVDCINSSASGYTPISVSTLRWASWNFGMVNIYRAYIFALLFSPLVAMGDGCSDETLVTKRYAKAFQCPAATIRTEGEKYPEDKWECYDLVPIKSETLFYSSGKTKGTLPSVNSLLPSGEKDFKNRTWVASNIRCNGKDKISVLYWGGGSCKGCERNVQYRFSKDGKLEEAKLQ